MAAEESTRASDTGPVIPISGAGEGSEPPDLSVLSDILGEFNDALCLFEVICLALESAEDESTTSVATYAVALRQSIRIFDQAYERFDLALVALPACDPGDADAGEDNAFDDAADLDEAP